MPKKILLTAFCKDRPGIVADISQVIFENGYNLEDSSMTYLAGEFAILLLLSAPQGADMNEVSENLSSECRRLEREKGITAYIRTVSALSAEPSSGIQVKTIRVEGFDQAGIVYKVSRFLADSDINIRTLSSELKLSPQSGAALYDMTIKVEIPDSVTLSDLEDGLGRVGDQLNVDVTLS